MSTTEPRRHVLVWVAQEFLESEGMLHILQESGAVPGQEKDWEKIVEACENSGGFALAGKLVDVNHGAGIWISPPGDAGLEIMIPWHSVRSVVTAEEQHQIKIFGLVKELAKQPVKPPVPTTPHSL
jgi:hypothetical protein